MPDEIRQPEPSDEEHSTEEERERKPPIPPDATGKTADDMLEEDRFQSTDN